MDIHPPFGTHRPGPLAAGLMRLARLLPANVVGKELAHAVRSCTLPLLRAPVDVTVGDVRLRSHPHANYSEKKFLFTPWRLDPLELDLVGSRLPRGGTLVDVGANVGLHGLLLAPRLGAGGRIVAIEPNPPAFERLRCNIAFTGAGREDWPRFDLVPLGVSEVAGSFDLHLVPSDLGSSSLLPPSERDSTSAAGATVRVACRPFAAILDEQGVDRIDALKIDIEGAEDAALMPFLADAPDTRLPRTIMIENSESSWTRDLPGALAGRGYSVALRTRQNSVHVLEGS